MDTLHKLCEDVFDQGELVRLLNAAAVALRNKETVLRLCCTEGYSGSPSNPSHYYLDLREKLEAVLVLAAKSDQFSFRSTADSEALGKGLQNKDTVAAQEEVEGLKMFINHAF